MQLFYTELDFSPRLDFCVLIKSNYLFCSPCITAIEQRCSSKYSALNAVNITLCQDYSCVLHNLTLTEKCLIMRSHSIISILKLCFNNICNPVAYNWLCGHVIVLSQDSGPLLDILPSAEIKLHKKIKIIWFENRSLTADNLKSYLEVWKKIIYLVLQ